MAADTEGDGEGMEVSGIPGFSTLALYLAASGVLLFLHSAVRVEVALTAACVERFFGGSLAHERGEEMKYDQC